MISYDPTLTSNEHIARPLEGYTNLTPIEFTIPTEVDVYNDQNITYVEYYFGDGTKSIVNTSPFKVSHLYRNPGTYSITSVAYIGFDGTDSPTISAVEEVHIKNYIDESIEFSIIPPPTAPGFFTEFPYKVYCTTTRIDNPPVIDLYAQFTRSWPPQSPQNKWSFTRPEWRFTDINKQVVNKVTPSYSEIRVNSNGDIDPNGRVVGLSGVAEFYFVEDLPSIDLYKEDKPTPLVWASIDVTNVGSKVDTDIKGNNLASFSTTRTRTFVPHISYWRLPTHLTISENGTRDFVNPRWTNATVPFFITVELSSSISVNLEQYRPDQNFIKYIPYSLSATALPVNLTISALDASTLAPITAVEFDSSTSISSVGSYHFKQYNTDGTNASGYIIGKAKVYEERNIVLSAAATFNFTDLKIPRQEQTYSPYLWIPNPAAGCVSMVYYSGSRNAAFQNALGEGLRTYKSFNINIPTVNNINLLPEDSYSGVYSVAASPGLSPDYSYFAWVADTDSDIVYKIDARGDIINYFNLRSITGNVSDIEWDSASSNTTGYNRSTPAGVALDSNKDLWVCMYNNNQVYKLTDSGSLAATATPPLSITNPTPNIPGLFSNDIAVDKFRDVPILEPTGIDTDTDNNIWVTYSNPISGYIIKYSTDGTYITHINTGPNTTPQDIIVDRDNTFWVAHTREVHGLEGSLIKYNSSGTPIRTINNIPGLGYITLDVNSNLWFTYDFNKIGKINVSGPDAFTHVSTVTSSNTSISSSPISSSDLHVQFSALEGIACNDKNFIFVVHSIDNKVCVYDSTGSLFDEILIKPHLQRGVYNDPNKDIKQSTEWLKSIQVFGDWTGMRWSKKYYKVFDETFKLTGVSTPLQVRDLNPGEIRKINQDFNMKDYIKGLINMDYFVDENPYLLDTVFKSIYGTSEFIDDTGTVIYEKIANLLSNTTDIDTCNIDSLYKIASMLNVKIDDVRLDIPYQMRQLVDLISISQKKLWGIKCKCNMNFTSNDTCTGTNICKICGKCKINNKGDLIDIMTYTVTVGTPFVVQEKGLDTHYLHYPIIIGGSSTYNVSQLSSVGFKYPIEENYLFFTYNNTTNNNNILSVIDWDNPYTTANYNISSVDEWKGDTGMMDTMLNYYLYRGLKLI